MYVVMYAFMTKNNLNENVSLDKIYEDCSRTFKLEIKRIGTSDPTVTIASTDLYKIKITLEIKKMAENEQL